MSTKRAPLGDIDINRAGVGPVTDNVKSILMSSENPFATKSKIRRTPDKSNPEGTSSSVPPSLNIVVEPNVMAGSIRDYHDMENIRPISMNKRTTPRVQAPLAVQKPVIMVATKKTVRATGITSNNTLESSSNSKSDPIQFVSNEEISSRMPAAVEDKIVDVPVVVAEQPVVSIVSTLSSSSSSTIENNINSEEEANILTAMGDFDQLSIAEILDAFREDAAAAEEALSLATSFGRLRPEEFREYLRAFRSPLKEGTIAGPMSDLGVHNLNEGDNNNVVDDSAMGGGFLMGIRGALTVPAYPSRYAHKQSSLGLGMGGNAIVAGTPKSTLWGLLGSADTPPMDIRVTDDVNEQTDDVEVCDINTSVCVAGPAKGKQLASATVLPSSSAAHGMHLHYVADTTITTASAVATTTSRRVSVKTMASLMSGAAEHASTTTVALSSTSVDVSAAATASSRLPSVSTFAIPMDDQTITTALPPMLEDNLNVEGAEMVPLGVFQPRKHLVRTPPKPTPAVALVPESSHMDDGPTGATVLSSTDIPVDAGVEGLVDSDSLTGTVAGAEVTSSPALHGEEGDGHATTTTTAMEIQTVSVQSVVEDIAVTHQVAACEGLRSPSIGGAALITHEEDQLPLWSAADLENVSRAIGRVSMGMSARAPCPATQSLVQQLQAELTRLRAEMQTQRIDVENQLQRATAGMQQALIEAQNRTRDHEHARIDAEIIAAREAVDRLAAEKAVIAQQRLVRQERLARMDAEVALELAALEAKRAQRGVRDQRLLLADAQPSSLMVMSGADCVGDDAVEEEGRRSATDEGYATSANAITGNKNNAGSLFSFDAAAGDGSGDAFLSLAITSHQQRQQTLVPSANCVFVAPKARRATTVSQMVVDTQPSTRPLDQPSSRDRTSLLGAATGSRQRLSSSSAFEPIDTNTSSSAAARNHNRATLATLPAGSSPLAARMHLQHEEVGEISVIDVEVTAMTMDGHDGHLPEDNDGGPLLDCNEYGLDDCMDGGDDDVNFGGREGDAPASISDEKKVDKKEVSNKQSKSRAIKAPRAHKSKGSDKGLKTGAEEASAVRPRLPFEHGNLKFVPLKVKQAWPRPIREKEFRAVARDHNYVKGEGTSSSSDCEDGHEDEDDGHGQVKRRKETGKRRERLGCQDKEEEDAEEDDGDASDGYEGQTKKKRRGGATKGAPAAAASMKDKNTEVVMKIKKGERKGAASTNVKEHDSKCQGQKKQGKKQTAAGGAVAIPGDAPAPVVEVVKELFPENSSNHLCHASDVDTNDNRVQEKPSTKPSKTTKSKAKTVAAASPFADPAPPAAATAAKTKAAAASKGIITTAASTTTVSTTAPPSDQVIVAPSVAVASSAVNIQGAPTRGQSSFALFCAVQKPLLLAEHPEAANSTIVKMLSALWKKLSPEEKKEWVMQATDGSAQASAAFDQKIASCSSSSVDPSEPSESSSSSSSSMRSVAIKSTKKSSKSKGATVASIEAASAVLAPVLQRIEEDIEEDETNDDDDDDDDDLFDKQTKNNKKSGKAAAAKKRKQSIVQKTDASDKEEGLAAKRGRTLKPSPVKSVVRATASPATKSFQQSQVSAMHYEENEAAFADENNVVAGKGGKENKGGKNKKRKQSAADLDNDDKENFLSDNVNLGMGASSSSSLSVAIDENPFLPINKSSRIVTSSSRGTGGEVEDKSAMPPPTKGSSKGKGKAAASANMTGTAAAANAAVLAARAMVALRKNNTSTSSSLVPLPVQSSSSSSSSSNITSNASNNNNTSVVLNTSVSTVSSLISGSSKMGKMGGMILPKLKMKK